jgi:PhnB protein
MSNATSYPTVTPYLIVPDADAILRFVTRAFGATEQMVQRNADGSVAHAEMKIGDSLIMVGQAGGPWKPKPAALYLWIGDVDAAYRRALEAGATSETPPEDKPYGQRMAGVDVGGVTWWLAAPLK